MTQVKERKSGTSKATSSRKAAAKPRSKAGDKPKSPAPLLLEAHELHGCIQEAAYFKAEQRNFAAGFELQDWLEAESELTANVQSAMDDTLP